MVEDDDEDLEAERNIASENESTNESSEDSLPVPRPSKRSARRKIAVNRGRGRPRKVDVIRNTTPRSDGTKRLYHSQADVRSRSKVHLSCELMDNASHRMPYRKRENISTWTQFALAMKPMNVFRHSELA